MAIPRHPAAQIVGGALNSAEMILSAHTAQLAAAIPGARKIIVSGASHFGPLEQPEVYNAMVLNFLDAP